jgi:hypothetical protein
VRPCFGSPRRLSINRLSASSTGDTDCRQLPHNLSTSHPTVEESFHGPFRIVLATALLAPSLFAQVPPKSYAQELVDSTLAHIPTSPSWPCT